MRAVIASGLLLLTLAGCMNYRKPPIAVTKNSYTELQEKEKTVLPADLKLLTLAEAQRIALANNPDFQGIQFTIDAARARYYQSFSSYAPTLNAGMSIAQSFSNMHSSGVSGRTHSQAESYSPNLSGQWLIFDCLAREMNMLAAKYKLNQAESTVADARRLLLRAVAYAYNDILLSITQKAIVIAQIEYSQRMLTEAENKYKAGTVLLSDVLNFQIGLENGNLELVKIDYTIVANKYILAGYLGLIDGTIPDQVAFPEIQMTGEDEYLADVSVYLDQALANRPDLKAYRDMLRSAQYSYWATLADFGPTVSANYSLGFTQNRNIRHDSGSSSGSSSSGVFGYGVNAEWNLFNGFSSYNATKAALANVAETDYLMAQNWISVITDVRTAYANYRSSLRQVKMSQKVCQLTGETRQLVENEYNAGTALVTRLNEAERALVQAQNNLAGTIVNIANAKAQLEAAVYAATPAPAATIQ